MAVWQTAAIAAAAFWAGGVWFEWYNVFRPRRGKPEMTPADAGLEFEDVTFVAEDGKVLHGWWIPNSDAIGTILYCHGNADNIGGRVGLCADLHRIGVNVFIFDYRGYGLSRGIPTEHGVYRDARAAYEVVRARHQDSDHPPVIVYGGSLGGAVALQVALDRPVRGVILECTFTSILDMGKQLYPWLPIRLVSLMRFDSLRKISRLNVPKLIAHSCDDELIPYTMGRQLYDAAKEPKTFFDLTGKHDEAGWNAVEHYWHEIERFVRKTLS
jgi:fermentation-respiration switch protein FrsA (DUF1100 family)